MKHQASGWIGFFFFQAEDGIRDRNVTGVQTCALPILVEATDAAHASELLEMDRSIDLVITDMVMPGKSGGELVAELAHTHPGLPVVIMSGYSEETASRQWRVPENAAFIEKPVSPKALVALVERLVVGKPMAS